jgi:hypothetical protein
VALFKVEALNRYIERLEARHEDLRSKLRTFQEQRMQRVEHVKDLQHNSRNCWASLTRLYLDKAENRIETGTQLMDQYLQGRVGIDQPVGITPRTHAPYIVAPGLFKPSRV